MQNDGKHCQRILKLGELDALYPFAQMMGSHGRLSSWIALKGQSQIQGTIKQRNDGLTFEYKSASEIGREILQFLSLTTEEQDAKINELQNAIVLDDEGTLRDRTGMIMKYATRPEALHAHIEDLGKRISKARKTLKQLNQQDNG